MLALGSACQSAGKDEITLASRSPEWRPCHLPVSLVAPVHTEGPPGNRQRFPGPILVRRVNALLFFRSP